jgi:hypothetical protein
MTGFIITVTACNEHGNALSVSPVFLRRSKALTWLATYVQCEMRGFPKRPFEQAEQAGEVLRASSVRMPCGMLPHRRQAEEAAELMSRYMHDWQDTDWQWEVLERPIE